MATLPTPNEQMRLLAAPTKDNIDRDGQDGVQFKFEGRTYQRAHSAANRKKKGRVRKACDRCRMKKIKIKVHTAGELDYTSALP